MMLSLFLSASWATAGASCLDVDAVRDAAAQAGLGGVYGDTPRAVLASVAGATSFAPGQTTEAALWRFATMGPRSAQTFKVPVCEVHFRHGDDEAFVDLDAKTGKVLLSTLVVPARR